MNKHIKILILASLSTLWGCSEVAKNSSASKKSEGVIIQPITQKSIDNIAENLIVKYELISNQQKEKCDKNQQGGLCFEAQLSLTAKTKIDVANWKIFYSQIAPLHNFDSDEFVLKHINGDLHTISPSEKFSGFSKGETKVIVFRAGYWSLAESDIMPNYIITSESLTAKVIESTRAEIDQDTGLEIVPYVESYSDYQKHFQRSSADSTPWKSPRDFYKDNSKLGKELLDVSNVIIPTPKSMVIDNASAQLNLAKGLNITFNNVEPSSVHVALARLESFGIKQSKQGIPISLSLFKDKTLVNGHYQLIINEQGINIKGADMSGVFYGLQSLASLVSLDHQLVSYMTVIDEPLYEFRGMLVDTARNFRSKDFIFKLLDQMAAYKLNKLHLHMAEDEAWRLEIPGLPELTDVGSKRCFDLTEQHCLMPQLGAGVDPNSSVNGYYSVADYSEILKAATARHIQVLPSLDMPGHSRAAIKAMEARYNKYSEQEDQEKAEQYLLHDPNDLTKYSSVQFYNDNTINACQESSYAFVEKVMKEVQQIHINAGQPLTRYHIGADETAGAWLESDVCKAFIANNDKGITDMKQIGAYFIERVANMLADMGIETAGWSDGLEHTNKDNMPAVVQANAWDHLPWGAHTKVNELANRNWQVVNSTPDVTYFDFPYEADPKEHGYYWASRKTNTEKVFQFMPENLPVHAEFWLDREDNPYVADDTKQVDEQGNVISTPLEQGRKFFGLQGQLWGENLRLDTMADYKIFPRIIALAERAWHLADWAVPYNYDGFKYSQETEVFTKEMQTQRDKQWTLFANAIGQKEFPKLSLANIFYRLPTVGAVIKEGKLHANTAFPGTAIEYKEKDGKWTLYSQPVSVDGEIQLRTISVDGKRKGRTTILR
ncbi:family 20 glycosylhydrolase [Thalassotalea profundi]|uniref:beta-N-acetylhexosaminidase n=1 Tax=Thalassotalea profundi TaxID=2036687 RepID=A0ABQ3J0X7_9GAMM|nr:family 20 glycosylhydrolase [Thalassotalea profundi]GHE95320.1 beta-N-acetylhexosaminidase [Thalassotalea profundi]